MVPSTKVNIKANAAVPSYIYPALDTPAVHVRMRADPHTRSHVDSAKNHRCLEEER
jgi:hypothetical protein